MKKKVKITLIISGIILGLLFLAILILPSKISVAIYKDNFEKRFTTYEGYLFYLDDFEGLVREKRVFPSDKGQLLAGYKYYSENVDVKGLLVLAHGFGGGGHNGYLNVVDYFTKNGYIVFAYDATGNDESEGSAVGGLPQGLIDVDYALQFVKSEKEFENLPIFLWGHSWGGYSVGSVTKLHPDVKAAVVVAGFNQSVDMLETEGRKIAGDVVDLLIPPVKKYETKKYGKYASMSVLESVSESKVPTMFIHSKDDEMIPYEISFARYYEKFGTNPNYLFVSYEDKGHSYVYCSENSKEFRNQYEAKKNEFKASSEDITDEMIIAFDKENFTVKLAYELDISLMEQMLEFYDSHK